MCSELRRGSLISVWCAHGVGSCLIRSNSRHSLQENHVEEKVNYSETIGKSINIWSQRWELIAASKAPDNTVAKYTRDGTYEDDERTLQACWWLPWPLSSLAVSIRVSVTPESSCSLPLNDKINLLTYCNKHTYTVYSWRRSLTSTIQMLMNTRQLNMTYFCGQI